MQSYWFQVKVLVRSFWNLYKQCKFKLDYVTPINKEAEKINKNMKYVHHHYRWYALCNIILLICIFQAILLYPILPIEIFVSIIAEWLSIWVSYTEGNVTYIISPFFKTQWRRKIEWAPFYAFINQLNYFWNIERFFLSQI